VGERGATEVKSYTAVAERGLGTLYTAVGGYSASGYNTGKL